eukprot:434619_1
MSGNWTHTKRRKKTCNIRKSQAQLHREKIARYRKKKKANKNKVSKNMISLSPPPLPPMPPTQEITDMNVERNNITCSPLLSTQYIQNYTLVSNMDVIMGMSTNTDNEQEFSIAFQDTFKAMYKNYQIEQKQKDNYKLLYEQEKKKTSALQQKLKATQKRVKASEQDIFRLIHEESYRE